MLARLLGAYRAELDDLSALVLAQAAREIDQAHAAGRPPARRGQAVLLRPAAE